MHRPKGDDEALSLLRRSRSGFRSHVVHVMVNVMNVMVVVMMMVHGSRRSGSRSRLLRHSVAGEAERENGRGGKGLDHERTILWLGKPKWVASNDRDLRLNSI
jgi:hypothetical protein